MPMRPVKDAHGRVVSYEFEPSAKMQRVVIEMNKAEKLNLSNEEILKKCKVTQAEWERWWKEYEIVDLDPDGNVRSKTNYFEIWFDDALQIKSGDLREMLLFAGAQRALANDSKAHHYWIPLSKTLGVIGEQAPPAKTKIPFNLRQDATSDELMEARRSLLESHRALGDGGGSGLARLAARRPKGAGN